MQDVEVEDVQVQNVPRLYCFSFFIFVFSKFHLHAYNFYHCGAISDIFLARIHCFSFFT